MAKAKKEPAKRETLEAAVKLGKGKFLGWKKLAREPIMAGRFEDGTVVYRGFGKAWVFGKAA